MVTVEFVCTGTYQKREDEIIITFTDFVILSLVISLEMRSVLKNGSFLHTFQNNTFRLLYSVAGKKFFKILL